MPPPSASELVLGLQETLRSCGFDYEQKIDELGQVQASEQRASGRIFSLRDHLRGLVLSQLSNQREWKQIAENLERVSQVFLDYDPDALSQADPMVLKAELCAIRCGNLAIRNQLNALGSNIETLRRIERDYGSLDKFVTSSDPSTIAKHISDAGSYKLKYIGFALALEYLRNVGISAIKPDLHLLRILGGERLAYFEGNPEGQEVVHLVADLAAQAGCSATYLDNLLWLYCAQNYGAVCSANPRCEICALRHKCHFPALHPNLGSPVPPHLSR